MKLRTCLVAFAVLGMVASAIPAKAADYGIYVAPKLIFGVQSLNSLSAKGTNGGKDGLSGGHDWNLGIAGAIGFDLYPQYMVPARIELELATMGKMTEKGDTNHVVGGTNYSYKQKNAVNTLFVNAFLDWHNSSAFTPYAGLGIGGAWVKSSGSLHGPGLGSNTETNLAWNLGLGVAWGLSYNASIDLGYRYASFGKAKTDVNQFGYLESKMAMHQIMCGVRYTF